MVPRLIDQWNFNNSIGWALQTNKKCLVFYLFHLFVKNFAICHASPAIRFMKMSRLKSAKNYTIFRKPMDWFLFLWMLILGCSGHSPRFLWGLVGTVIMSTCWNSICRWENGRMICELLNFELEGILFQFLNFQFDRGLSRGHRRSD